jgi:hypothetical protein
MAALGILGVAAFAWQVTEVLSGSHVLIVDFADTAFTPYRLWRLALPDLRRSSAATPWLVAAWTCGIVASSALGVRASRSAPRRRSGCLRRGAHLTSGSPPASTMTSNIDIDRASDLVDLGSRTVVPVTLSHRTSRRIP